MARQPNFLLFVTDQQRADHLGCSGGPLWSTPHIDRLAAQGSRFTDFHVATPICQPNRASLMTGRLPSAHGVQMNGRELSHGERTFVETLRESGYRTALVGKAHLQNITAVPARWPLPEERLPRDARRPWPGVYGQEVADRWEAEPDFELQLPYYGYERVALTIGHADEQHGHWRRWLRQQLPDADRLIGPDNAIPTPGWALPALRQAWRTRVPEALYPTRYIAEQTCALLQDMAAQDAPFFVQCSFPDPHHPFTPPGRYWDLRAPEDMPLPDTFAATLVDPPPPVQWLHAQRTQRGGGFRPGYASFAVTEREMREALALNAGSLACIDDAVGRGMATLAQLGLDRDTVVIFTSDHADLFGDRGLMFKGGLHYGALTRVPFIWRDPQAAQGGVCHADLAQSIDLAPTVLARAGLAPTHGMQGQSLLPVLAGQSLDGRDALLIEEEGQRRDYGMAQRMRLRTLRTATHRLTVYQGQDWGELYDLHNDPQELRNLWDEPASQKLRHALTDALVQAMLRAADDSPWPTASA